MINLPEGITMNGSKGNSKKLDEASKMMIRDLDYLFDVILLNNKAEEAGVIFNGEYLTRIEGNVKVDWNSSVGGGFELSAELKGAYISVDDTQVRNWKFTDSGVELVISPKMYFYINYKNTVKDYRMYQPGFSKNMEM
jgi:hypothetical protein